jgi:hypothetical protein
MGGSIKWLGDEATVGAAVTLRAGFATEGPNRETGSANMTKLATRHRRAPSGIEVALNGQLFFAVKHQKLILLSATRI